jgi:mRNA-degrading endonuclease YafQ of YafQ-DinJ toxin-antitoxin module
MYQFSRSLYRRLAPRIVGGSPGPGGLASRRQVLEACEAMMTRMAEDRDYVAHPARTLFNDIRACFSLPDQLLVYSIVKRHIELADDYLARLPGDVTAFGARRQCHASTRRGTPCRREPLPGCAYCPSHKHLEEAGYVAAA